MFLATRARALPEGASKSVLVISGYDEALVRRSGFIAAFGGQPRYRFLEKPFEFAMLLECVEELVDSPEEVVEVATGEWSVPDR